MGLATNSYVHTLNDQGATVPKTRKQQEQNSPLENWGGVSGRRARGLAVNQPTEIPRKPGEEINQVLVSI